ncbi:alpha/beta fold hydrolase [Streptomyces sp. NPDC006692]|uniref:alpha/beta fold hydrolase n=1 Tax=Streptomyces sp. NPDC006692 TaxID=3364758 RepID=UPI0036A88FC1
MPKHSIHAVTAAAALACLAAYGPAPGSAVALSAGATGPSSADPHFVPGPCPKTPEPIEALGAARCGTLQVPENRSRHDAKTIKLAVARIPAVSSKPAAEPVVFLAGGPGADAFDDIPFLVDSGLNKDRELIIMAQRGNLYDQPNLACPEIDRSNAQAVGLRFGAQPAQQLMLKAVKECRDRLTRGGVDLSAYNTAENAADFADLRTALGIRRWNVYGYSYGTDLALTYLRLYPDGIRALAIDSITPPQSAVLPWGWSSAAEGIGNIFKACAAQPACKERYPDPARTLTEQVRKLEAKPLTLNATPPHGDKPVKVVLDGGALLDTIVAFGVRPEDLPAALTELAAGRPKRFATARAAGSVQHVGMFAHGLTNSVACSEWAPGASERDVLEAGKKAFPGWPDTVLAQVPQLPYEYPACGIWKVPDRAAGQRVTTVSPVPSLVISDTFDAKTGVSWAKGVIRDQSRSTAVRIPGIGRWVVPQSSCAQRVLASFLARPTAPDTTCVNGLKPQPFTIIPK